MLQILINHYRESEELIGRLLKSIEMQEAVSDNDYEVFVYSDGDTNVLSEQFLNSFRFPIHYKMLPHRGVCATRNELLNDATAEYVMFCDADDCFHSTLGLYRLLKAIQDLGMDVIGSPYESEQYIDGIYRYRTLIRDTIRVHGKVFKREYLVQNHIYYPDEMPISGDMYFLWQAFNLTTSIGWIRESFYVWKYNPNSVTRHNPYHHLNTYCLMLKNYMLLIDNLEERQRFDLRDKLVAAVVQMIFADSTNKKYMDGPESAVMAAKCAMAECVKRYSELYFTLSDDLKSSVYKVTETTHPGGKKCESIDEITNWAKRVVMDFSEI